MTSLPRKGARSRIVSPGAGQCSDDRARYVPSDFHCSSGGLCPSSWARTGRCIPSFGRSGSYRLRVESTGCGGRCRATRSLRPTACAGCITDWTNFVSRTNSGGRSSRGLSLCHSLLSDFGVCHVHLTVHQMTPVFTPHGHQPSGKVFQTLHISQRS